MEARQTPTFERFPAASAATDGPMGTRLASSFFGDPLPWQQHVLDVLLARDARDKYAYHAVALSVPRQNGKSWDARSRCFYGIVAEGEKVLYTCQHGDTADEMFRDLSNVFEDEDNEELHAMLKAVRKTNGQQAIYLENGGYIRFTTRTNSLARGRSYDVIVYDEAQELTAAQQAASLPTISASSKHNTQVVYLGTPPNPECPGTVFVAMHDQAHGEKAPAFAWMEWAVPEIGDVADRARWYEANPSLGPLIDETAIEGELSMSPEDFARERLGWWLPERESSHSALSSEDWRRCAVSDDEARGIHGLTAFGVKFSPDGRTFWISAAIRPEEGYPYVELIDIGDAKAGTPGLAAWIADRRSRTSCTLIDGKDGAPFAQRLRDLGMTCKGEVIECSPREAQAAASTMVDRVGSGQMRHPTSQALDESACGSVRRSIGRTGYGFGDGPTAESGAIESAALALEAVLTTRRNPQRKARIG